MRAMLSAGAFAKFALVTIATGGSRSARSLPNEDRLILVRFLDRLGQRTGQLTTGNTGEVNPALRSLPRACKGCHQLSGCRPGSTK